MTVRLDPKFLKVVALMRSTQHDGERAAAQARAEAMATAAGMTLDEAMTLASAPKPTGIFEGFDDFCERTDPGFKARQAAERLAKHRAWRARRAAILEKYRSEDAAIAPCQREQCIRDAVAQWRTPSDVDQRWTHALDGWRGDFWRDDRPSERVMSAIREAYPLPTTFVEAKAEHDYWEARNDELDDLFATNGAPIGDIQLDMPCRIRAAIVRALAEHELSVTTLTDLHARFAMMRESEISEDKMEAALFRDLSAMVEHEKGYAQCAYPSEGSAQCAHLFSVSTDARDTHAVGILDLSVACCRQDGAVHPSTRDGQIRAALDADPSRSDRAIARKVGCSPTTVGRVRNAMGLSSVDRSVHRRGQIYSMRPQTKGAPL